MFERKAFIYKFVGFDEKVLYVGKTVNLKRRMNEHFNCKSNYLRKQGLGEVYNLTQRVEFLICKDEYEALHKELEYITYYKPKFNTASKIKQIIPTPVDANKWKVYKVIKENTEQQLKINARNQKVEKLLPIAMLILFIAIIFNFVM